MKVRLSEQLNGLNISLDTAIKLLQKSGVSDESRIYTLNTVLTEEESNVLTSMGKIKNKAKQKEKQISKKETAKGKSSCINTMTCNRGFSSCFTSFIAEVDNSKKLAAIKEEMDKVFGEDVKISNIKLFRKMLTRQLRVNYNYYYYSLSGRRTLIQKKCIATWLASAFSEAVNQGLISKTDYHSIFKNHLWQDIQSLKKKKKKPTKPKRQWVSIISVPFGGMNRR